MESSDDKLTPQFCVQMIPSSQQHHTFTDIPEDIHICGMCKQSFTDIHLFLQHKSECSIILATASSHLVDTQVNYVISDQSFFRISGLSFDNTSLPIFIQSDDSTDKLGHSLRTHIISSTDQSSSKKDNIQIDEEDVAALLVNQLSKEVLNSAPIDIGPKDAQNIETLSSDLPVDNQDTATQNLSDLVLENTEDIVLAQKKAKVFCNVCNYVPQYPRDLVRHMRRHTGEKPYECNVCNRRFARHDKLQTHKRIHTGEKPYQCQLCSYASTDSGPMTKHLRTHTDERPHKCQMCPYRARDSSQLTVHLRVHTGDCPFICQVGTCGRAFKTSTDLKRHTNVHTRNSALPVNKTTNKGTSTEHPASQVMHFPCTLLSCDYIGNSLRDLRSHNKFHLGSSDVNISSREENKNIKSNKKTFSCHICSSNYRLKSNLQSHLKKHQMVSSSGVMRPICTKSQQCHLCAAAFVRADSLRSHLRQHQQNELESITVTPDSTAQDLDITHGHTDDFHTDEFELLVTTTAEGPTSAS